jgi:TruD family tRNA pseudouridine synthase
MKVKSRPDDFQVEELPTIQMLSHGRFRMYRLSKSGLGTIEALEVIKRRWNLPASAVSHGGLKDKHAQTIQYISIANGPGNSMEEGRFRLEPMGFINVPYGPSGFRGNKFTIRLRDLTKDKADQIRGVLQAIVREGVPNYFDDQRFGSVGVSGEFIIHAWMAEKFERALWLAMAEPYAFDRPDMRREKDLLTTPLPDHNQFRLKISEAEALDVGESSIGQNDEFWSGFGSCNSTFSLARWICEPVGYLKGLTQVGSAFTGLYGLNFLFQKIFVGSVT